MQRILSKYKTGNFELSINESLEKKCNSPKDGNGVYLVYVDELLLYIGSCGKMKNDGEINCRGLYDRIVNGHQFGKIPRKKSWLNQMKIEDITNLSIQWYITYDNVTSKDIPAYIEGCLLQRYFELNNKLPRWNKEF